MIFHSYVSLPEGNIGITSYCMGGWEYVFFSVGKKWDFVGLWSQNFGFLLRLFIDMFMAETKKNLWICIL